VLPFEGLYSFGSVMIESYFHGVRGVSRWPKDGGFEKGVILNGKVILDDSGHPWRLTAVHTSSGCIALTWEGKTQQGGAAIRNYVQNCDPVLVSALLDE